MSWQNGTYNPIGGGGGGGGGAAGNNIGGSNPSPSKKRWFPDDTAERNNNFSSSSIHINNSTSNNINSLPGQYSAGCAYGIPASSNFSSGGLNIDGGSLAAYGTNVGGLTNTPGYPAFDPARSAGLHHQPAPAAHANNDSARSVSISDQVHYQQQPQQQPQQQQQAPAANGLGLFQNQSAGISAVSAQGQGQRQHIMHPAEGLGTNTTSAGTSPAATAAAAGATHALPSAVDARSTFQAAYPAPRLPVSASVIGNSSGRAVALAATIDSSSRRQQQQMVGDALAMYRKMSSHNNDTSISPKLDRKRPHPLSAASYGRSRSMPLEVGRHHQQLDTSTTATTTTVTDGTTNIGSLGARLVSEETVVEEKEGTVQTPKPKKPMPETMFKGVVKGGLTKDDIKPMESNDKGNSDKPTNDSEENGKSIDISGRPPRASAAAKASLRRSSSMPVSKADIQRQQQQEEEDRPVKLGHRKKTRLLREAYYSYGDGAEKNEADNSSDVTGTEDEGGNVCSTDPTKNKFEEWERKRKEKAEKAAQFRPKVSLLGGGVYMGSAVTRDTSSEDNTSSTYSTDSDVPMKQPAFDETKMKTETTKHNDTPDSKSSKARTHNHVICRYELEESFPATMIEGSETTRRIMLGEIPSDDEEVTNAPKCRKPLSEESASSDTAISSGMGSETETDTDAEGPKKATQRGSISSASSSKPKRRKKRREPKTPTIKLIEPPMCPECMIPCPPQSLLFDEGYHAHDYYQFECMEDWIGNADAIVFVGTSFQVTITDVALAHARKHGVPVYNFNVDAKGNGSLESSTRLNAENIVGDVGETLPMLWAACEEEIRARGLLDELRELKK